MSLKLPRMHRRRREAQVAFVTNALSTWTVCVDRSTVTPQ